MEEICAEDSRRAGGICAGGRGEGAREISAKDKGNMHSQVAGRLGPSSSLPITFSTSSSSRGARVITLPTLVFRRGVTTVGVALSGGGGPWEPPSAYLPDALLHHFALRSPSLATEEGAVARLRFPLPHMRSLNGVLSSLAGRALVEAWPNGAVISAREVHSLLP